MNINQLFRLAHLINLIYLNKLVELTTKSRLKRLSNQRSNWLLNY